MSEKLLMKGNEALAEAALKAGCQLYFLILLHLKARYQSIWPGGCLS